jgi:hypothetical protein
MKAFLESFDIGSDDEEEESTSDASSEPIINPQRDLFGNSGFDSQEDFPGLDDKTLIPRGGGGWKRS